MANLPADRTKLNAAIANQQPSIVASSKANREALVEAYDTIDHLYQYLLSTILAGSLVHVRTTSNVTYYVNAATGNDANDGLIGSPLKTIQAAINKLPPVIDHTVTINVAEGTYAENVSIAGFVGRGSILITGSGAALTDTHLVTSIGLTNCHCAVFVEGLKLNNASGFCVSVYGCTRVRLRYLKMDVSATSYNGIYVESSMTYITNCSLSNRNAAIAAWASSTVFSNENAGSGNTVGLQAAYASTIGKAGTQPSGTTAESSFGGGQIRS